jgi:hypothetical protein
VTLQINPRPLDVENLVEAEEAKERDDVNEKEHDAN